MIFGSGQPQQFGVFDTERDAAEAYDMVAVDVYGRDTATNFATHYGGSSSPYTPHASGFLACM
jgi:3',5'-cyclic AMP phosphodiesterase CpdA